MREKVPEGRMRALFAQDLPAARPSLARKRWHPSPRVVEKLLPHDLAVVHAIDADLLHRHAPHALERGVQAHRHAEPVLGDDEVAEADAAGRESFSRVREKVPEGRMRALFAQDLRTPRGHSAASLHVALTI